MQAVRTIIWVALLIAFVALTLLNWDTQLAVRIWPGIVWDTRLPAVIVVAFLLGLIPMWLIHRGSKWRLQRRIGTLENAARAQAVTPAAPAHPAHHGHAAHEPALQHAPAQAADPATPAHPADPLTPAHPAEPRPVDGAPVPRDEILR